MYREWRSSLPGAVLWHRDTPSGEIVRVLPDGCQDLIWVDGELLVAGPDTVAQLATVSTGTTFVGLRFAPGTATAVLGAPARVLRNQRLRLADVWPGLEARQATARVAGAASPATALEEIARDRLRGTRWPDPAILEIVSRLRMGASVAGTAGALGSGQRRLHRRSLEVFGYGPKTLARILRLNRAIDLARAGTPFATVATATGYADQAHLAREVKTMAGITLTALVT
jgi:AraC-like DNA-binding protein